MYVLICIAYINDLALASVVSAGPGTGPKSSLRKQWSSKVWMLSQISCINMFEIMFEEFMFLHFLQLNVWICLKYVVQRVNCGCPELSQPNAKSVMWIIRCYHGEAIRHPESQRGFNSTLSPLVTCAGSTSCEAEDVSEFSDSELT